MMIQSANPQTAYETRIRIQTPGENDKNQELSENCECGESFRRNFIEDDMKGSENSRTDNLAAVTVKSAAIQSISRRSNIPTSPFHIPDETSSIPYLLSMLDIKV